MQTHSTTEAYRPNHVKKRWYQQLYFWVLLAIIIGVLLGWLSPSAGVAMEPIGTTFVTAMKMLIGPIVFLTIVGGIAMFGPDPQEGRPDRDQGTDLLPGRHHPRDDLRAGGDQCVPRR